MPQMLGDCPRERDERDVVWMVVSVFSSPPRRVFHDRGGAPFVHQINQ